MIPDHLPPTVRAIIEATAGEYGVTTDALFSPWPRAADPDAARCAAISRLANEQIDGRSRYTIADLMAWFDVSRPTINRYRARSAEYAPRWGPGRPRDNKAVNGAS